MMTIIIMEGLKFLSRIKTSSRRVWNFCPDDMYACAFAISPVPTLCVTTCTFRKKDEDFDVDGGGDDEDGDEDLDGDDEDFENYDKKG